eukprot:CAMPEP_0173380382 /NCGR_PEP_ID=MMETSP1356-20130122/3080_2 /TAXON_ID=77927 ORGANISM="Hemiselmis virescens, Strain PCC157" /NCGR_SAMPLE_ID=MMETSP1356 /ASSEMBLY_ACC=CAM_ASM_000847 /LENGTH=110 /DNA_ID=CAMNT_0014333953 /DNA_START=776 /DNA_END=1104 /DNA_ORIENTATION=-
MTGSAAFPTGALCRKALLGCASRKACDSVALSILGRITRSPFVVPTTAGCGQDFVLALQPQTTPALDEPARAQVCAPMKPLDMAAVGWLSRWTAWKNIAAGRFFPPLASP